MNFTINTKTAIYIPIWLDLLYRNELYNKYKDSYLHSNMVRFIIVLTAIDGFKFKQFTFQYG